MVEHEQEQNEALKVIIPDYIAYETKPWEDVAVSIPTLHSFIVLLCIFWASLFAVVVGRVTVGQETGSTPDNLQWYVRVVLQGVLSWLVWKHTLGDDFMPASFDLSLIKNAV